MNCKVKIRGQFMKYGLSGKDIIFPSKRQAVGFWLHQWSWIGRATIVFTSEPVAN